MGLEARGRARASLTDRVHSPPQQRFLLGLAAHIPDWSLLGLLDLGKTKSPAQT